MFADQLNFNDKHNVPLVASTLKSGPNRPNILIIYTGGTFGMTRRDDGSYEPANLKQQLHYIESINRPEMPTYDVVEWEAPIDSSDMTPEGWIKIAKQIEERYYMFDGFVVLHGAFNDCLCRLCQHQFIRRYV